MSSAMQLKCLKGDRFSQGRGDDLVRFFGLQMLSYLLSALEKKNKKQPKYKKSGKITKQLKQHQQQL
ncbi:hypothetical protein [Candidatus Ichthyocystis sparus]|uniref:hypothetical protein n=1 Tax=Candidatus Ichthyocystis sparus TaxID=1561004 RepID=UPI0011471548|nr:hypothetical protein [Candidatus Ichthyocystis sparus]